MAPQASRGLLKFIQAFLLYTALPTVLGWLLITEMFIPLVRPLVGIHGEWLTSKGRTFAPVMLLALVLGVAYLIMHLLRRRRQPPAVRSECLAHTTWTVTSREQDGGHFVLWFYNLEPRVLSLQAGVTPKRRGPHSSCHTTTRGAQTSRGRKCGDMCHSLPSCTAALGSEERLVCSSTTAQYPSD